MAMEAMDVDDDKKLSPVHLMLLPPPLRARRSVRTIGGKHKKGKIKAVAPQSDSECEAAPPHVRLPAPGLRIKS